MHEMTGASLQDITAFVAVTQTGSFTLAAERLGTNKSSVGKAIQRLEKHLATLLFQRTTRAVHITEDGQIYLAAARIALEHLREAEQALAVIAQNQWDACGSICQPASDAWSCPPWVRCASVTRKWSWKCRSATAGPIRWATAGISWCGLAICRPKAT